MIKIKDRSSKFEEGLDENAPFCSWTFELRTSFLAPRRRLGFGQGVTTPIGALFIGGYTLYNASVPNAGALQFAVELARIAHDHKSEDVITLDLRGINAVTDFTVIGTGTSERQIRAVAEHVVE